MNDRLLAPPAATQPDVPEPPSTDLLNLPVDPSSRLDPHPFETPQASHLEVGDSEEEGLADNDHDRPPLSQHILTSLPCPICISRPPFGSLPAWKTHLHLHIRDWAAGNGPEIPQAALNATGLWLCRHCLVLVPSTRRCRICKAWSPAKTPIVLPPPPADVVMIDLNEASLLDSFSSHWFPVLRYLPKGFEDTWFDLLALELMDFMRAPSLISGLYLIALPVVILEPLPRGGRGRGASLLSHLMDRSRRWKNGQKHTLVSDLVRRVALPKAKKPKISTLPTQDPLGPLPDDTRRAVMLAVREGALGKATKILCDPSGGVITGSEAREKLSPLHPSNLDLLPHLVVAPIDLPSAFSIDQVQSAICSFPSGSAGGLGGLMPVHLPRGGTPAETRVQDALVKFCSLFAQGALPASTRAIFCNARIIALAKRPSGVRPIAVGEVLRRLTAKLLLKQHLDEVLPHLHPWQVGVGVRGGSESVIHDIRAWADTATPGDGVLGIDFRNAFNEIDRGHVLRQTHKLAPSFFPYADFCYGCPTSLLGNGFKLSSEQGTAQGDPLAPLLFVLGLKTLVDDIQKPEAYRQHVVFG